MPYFLVQQFVTKLRLCLRTLPDVHLYRAWLFVLLLSIFASPFPFFWLPEHISLSRPLPPLFRDLLMCFVTFEANLNMFFFLPLFAPWTFTTLFQSFFLNLPKSAVFLGPSRFLGTCKTGCIYKWVRQNQCFGSVFIFYGSNPNPGL